ncbi:MAG: hypothetical protein JW927_09235 [Deltaproteobacteria bacterium]|nr:hypothetical protein [Deltaproteobacteria bacterium]
MNKTGYVNNLVLTQKEARSLWSFQHSAFSRQHFKKFSHWHISPNLVLYGHGLADIKGVDFLKILTY